MSLRRASALYWMLGLPAAAGLGSDAAFAGDDVPRIPLRVGLTIVTAIEGSDGDYESIKSFESEDAKGLRLKYSSETLVDEGIDTEPNQYEQFRPSPTDNIKAIRTLTVYRNVLRSDLKTADHYLNVYDMPPAIAETVPGTTAVGTSAAVLTSLKTRGEAELTTYVASFDAAPLTDADSTQGSIVDPRERGTLRRIEKTPVPVPVIVNGHLVRLPAVHARGTLGVDDGEFWLLDDADNPLALKFKIGNTKLTVIRINFPGTTEMMASAAGDALETSLAKTGRAVVYGIYFGFNSDLIRPESTPVLKEIAAVLDKHPDWKLDVGGHTDNIGGAAFNLSLSLRRAAAVKKALVDRYHIAAARLAADGFGLTQPKAPNDTVEGRALNRRVELIRP